MKIRTKYTRCGIRIVLVIACLITCWNFLTKLIRYKEYYPEIPLIDNKDRSSDRIYRGDITQTPQRRNTNHKVSDIVQKNVSNDLLALRWQDRLFTPTYLTKIDNMYVLVDCWHHRVLYTEELSTPVGAWRSFEADDHIWIPHSVATNGNIVAIESSDHGSAGTNHSLALFRIERNNFSQIINFRFYSRLILCPGKKVFRPHRTIYDKRSDSFFVYMTNPPTLARYRWSKERQDLEYVYCKDLRFMKKTYSRSFTINDGIIYFAAGPSNSIVLARLVGHDLIPVYMTRVDLSRWGIKSRTMNDVAFLDGYWYLSSSYPCQLLRARRLGRGEYERLDKKLSLCRAGGRDIGWRCKKLGTPYFLSIVDGYLIVPFLFSCSGVLTYNLTSGESRVLWGSGWSQTPADTERRGNEW